LKTIAEAKLEHQSPFDRLDCQEFTKARQEFVASLLAQAKREITLSSAADIGCGVGYFSKFLSDLGLRVVGVDGREENAAECKRRYPEITFVTANAEDLPKEIGIFDVVLCFGLLYHLENPFRAIRGLHTLTGKLLLVESMCVPEDEPTMRLLDEGVAEDQGLNYVAFYPSESCVIKMLYRAGFPFVYKPKELPGHELYGSTAWQKRRRTMLLASNVVLNVPGVVLVSEAVRPVHAELDSWSTGLRKVRVVLGRVKNRVLHTFRTKESSLAGKRGNV
jgi:SAM-dependent methyltransferase